jgi:hypothetical protein
MTGKPEVIVFLRKGRSAGGFAARCARFLHAELSSSARVGKYMELAIGPILNPVTQEVEQLFLDKPTGFTSTRAAIGRSLTFKVNAGLQYEHSGKYAEFSHFSYSGQGEA